MAVVPGWAVREEMTGDITEAREYVWRELRRHPIRRALLGRDRCDVLTRLALRSIPEGDLAAAGEGTDGERWVRSRVEARVLANYSEPVGVAFTTLILMWAISTIVQMLIIRWWRNRDAKD